MAFLCYRRITRWSERSGGPASHPLFFVNKPPDGAHQMRHRDVSTPFPENLRDPMDGEPAAVSFQNLFLYYLNASILGCLR